MCLKVRQGKGGKDRYTLLSPRLLERCAYWQAPGRGAGCSSMARATARWTIQTAQRIYYAARNAAGIAPAGGIHTLRHAFATHLLEAGVDIYTIERLLGHGHVGNDDALLAPAHSRLTGTASPLELLGPD